MLLAMGRGVNSETSISEEVIVDARHYMLTITLLTFHVFGV
jgi:hypothetical protein